MTESDVAWLAGILEGEGYFCYQGTPWIRLSMTDRDIVERAAAIMSTHCHPMAIRPNRKQAFRANVCGDRAIEKMRAILPYMGIRRSAKIREVLAKTSARVGIACGERAGSSRLTDAQADEIRKLYKKKYARGQSTSGIALSRLYGVSPSAIYYVIKNRRNSNGTQPIRT